MRVTESNKRTGWIWVIQWPGIAKVDATAISMLAQCLVAFQCTLEDLRRSELCTYIWLYIYIFIFSGRVDFSISYVAIFYPKREHVRPESCLPDMWIAQILEFPCPKKDHSAIEERTGHPNLTSAVCIVPLFCCWLSPCCRLIPWDFRTELLLACGRNV